MVRVEFRPSHEAPLGMRTLNAVHSVLSHRDRGRSSRADQLHHDESLPEVAVSCDKTATPREDKGAFAAKSSNG